MGHSVFLRRCVGIAIAIAFLVGCVFLTPVSQMPNTSPPSSPTFPSPPPALQTPTPTFSLPTGGSARLLPTASGYDLSDPYLGFPPSKPVPLGYSLDDASYGLYAVLEVIRPADDLVAEMKPDYPPPEAGTQYLVVRFSMACTAQADSGCAWDSPDGRSSFGWIDAEGNEYDPLWDPRLPNHILFAKGGEELEVDLAFAVPASLQHPVLVFSRYMFGEFYFALE